jgi:hypothetical protein
MKVRNSIKNIFYKVIFIIFILLAFVTIFGCNPISEQPIEVENYPPNILSEPIQVTYVGEEYTYNIEAYDVEGDTLVYSFNIKPQGMEINSSNGSITWTPALSQLGENKVEVKVSDNNLFETQSFKIIVYKSVEEEEIARIFFNPLSQDVSLNSKVDIEVKIENVFHLKGASIGFNFEADKLQYDSAINEDFIPNATLLEQTIDNIDGEVILDIAGLGINSYASGCGTLFTVTFNAISLGNSNVTFNISELRDNKNNQINHNTGNDCTIYVN